ncbi:MAG TPA: 1-deoxy-D-xylulose-5-phosphate reductoisomerase [Candidatus Sumerlaeota bacterium]|nr:1-deoxy-D-xylulose-5-phosphate reductoisomerase [Candidatus Sumerlaeota bacterium]HOR28551.1 1-deoxy-D-xylulose-5-phosphate reductoisomerase [Candidatus Sumerlaeota bacterium]HPK04151.1 1-deoxy-D-xylulose-5-phosphate reductoisomerase [Candidatus Sumerlaeota bacterium]
MASNRKRLCVLGSTGSIGETTLAVVRDYADRFQVVGLSAHAAADALAVQAREFGVEHVCLTGNGNGGELEALRPLRGEAGLVELIDRCEPDMVVVATVGAAGLPPTLRAIERRIPIALANKEVLVTAGDLVMRRARRLDVPILPIDSEHNAIFQCLGGVSDARRLPLRRIILTASGGPFRGRSRAELSGVTREEALNHPTWNMGRKITIDSATLMNKGFEVIEVHHLFGVETARIEVIIHPQSVIHSLIEYHDGSMLAQMGVTNMYLPIANVLAYPERLENARFAPLDLAAVATLTFEAPDLHAFPCLRYAYEAVEAGQTYPTVLNAANEIAVRRFLEGEIAYLGIPALIDAALQAHRPQPADELEAIAEADRWARAYCESRAPMEPTAERMP